MNSKKRLSRIMSALLAATSMIGGASAGKKKVGKSPGNAGVIVNKGGNRLSPSRGESAPTLLKNPKTYYFGVPCLITTVIVGYGLCRCFSGGENEKRDVYKIGDVSGYELLGEWGLGEFADILSIFSFRVLENEKFGRLVCVSRHIDGYNGDDGINFEFYFRIDGKKDIIGNLFGAYCCYYAAAMILFDSKFTTKDDAFKFWSEQCSDSKVGGNFTNIVNGSLFDDPSGYFSYLRDKLYGKVGADYSQSLFKGYCDSYSNRFDKLRDVLVANEKEIYVNKKDGGVYLRDIKKKQ